MSCMPITLVGDKLSLRHRHLNALVAEYYQKRVPFDEIQAVQERTPVDRLFKIDLASKLRNVNFILQNIKHEDMLYVSRALKAKWILDREYQHLMNPKYLESNLYPYMVTTAVSKFKNWLYLNLKDSERCAQFYKFYAHGNFDYAIKFLRHCSADFILREAPQILEKLSPHYFKVLCEKCPQVAKIYFDNITCNDELKIKFLDNQLGFFNSLKVVLKLDANIFFEITEKYFTVKFSRAVTKHIMTHHRDKFDAKPELYAAILLDVQTVAECLTVEECKQLVLELVRAAYLSYRINYKFVEPLIKRIPTHERSAFKKRVFVDKNVGELVEAWPYEIPSLRSRNEFQVHVFDDREHVPLVYCDRLDFKSMLKKRKYGKFQACPMMCSMPCPRIRTYLDKLFDEYRFVSFEKTLYELRTKIKEDSSSQNRQYMMLVLVSKSGGQPQMVASLLQLLEQHLNEPAHVRATVVRSLVKRAAVWRLPQPSWNAMLQFARGLGLDGTTPEADCREGLHAVVIRSLLETGACEKPIRDAYLKEFSNLEEYATNKHEREIVREKLALLLITAAEAESSLEKQVELLSLLLDMYQKYKMNIETAPLLPAVANLAKRDASAAEGILRRLFQARVGRRILFRFNFPLVQTDASYVNALRHDTSILNVTILVDLVEKNEIHPEQFLRKLAIYFAEPQGMVENYLNQLRERVHSNPSIGRSIARPLGLLQGACLTYLETLNLDNKAMFRLVAAVKANMHAGRPKLDIKNIDMSAVGVKAVANEVLVCPSAEADIYINKLLKWNRTVRVALVLAERIGKEADAFIAAAALRPTATLKAALKYLRRRGDDFDPRVWEDTLKLLLTDLDLCHDKRMHIRHSFINTEKIPAVIKPAYTTILFEALKQKFSDEAITILGDIENILPDVEEDFLEKQLLDFLRKFKHDESQQNHHESNNLYIRVLAKFLLLCKSEETQKKRWENLKEPFLKFLTLSLNNSEKYFMNMFDEILLTLQYNRVFFDDHYISPLPILEHIVSWMRQYLPIEVHFNKYVCIHLTMLYLKSVRQSTKSHPEIFNNLKRKLSEGISIVGFSFGKNIALEIKQLMECYFESAIELYRTGIQEYFTNYFEYDVTKFKFIKAVVQGIVEGSVGDEVRTALYIVNDEISNFDRSDSKELIEGLKNIENEKFKYFFNAEYYNLKDYLEVY